MAWSCWPKELLMRLSLAIVNAGRCLHLVSAQVVIVVVFVVVIIVRDIAGR